MQTNKIRPRQFADIKHNTERRDSAYVRFYSPTEAFFNQTWQPDDIIETN